MSFDYSTLITDRTKADADRVYELTNKYLLGTISDDEITEYLQGMKGAYNAIDLNRVGRAISDIAERLLSFGYGVDVAPKTDWLVSDTPTASQLARYLNDIAAIRAALAVLPTTPAAPTAMEKLKVEEANAIEKIMADVDTVIRSMLKVVPRAAQPLVYCGFVMYPAHPEPDVIENHVYTRDGLAVYTRDGLAVLVR